LLENPDADAIRGGLGKPPFSCDKRQGWMQAAIYTEVFLALSLIPQ
jgi:hypothetical protein